MKKLLSTVLAVCMILGCIAVGFTAQAATEADLQNGINAAINGSGVYTWTGGNINLTKPLTINGNVKVDFKGATIKGAPHQNTIAINGGNVELINADIEGIDAAYDGIVGFVKEVTGAHPTVNIGNANVTLTNLVVTGAYITVYGTGEEFPMSDAISIWGANGVVNLNNVRAFGNVGVDNKRGSKVNVTECIIGGTIDDFGDKKNVSYADGTVQYAGYDLLVEALADYITLTPGEEDLLFKFFDTVFEVTASVKAQEFVEPTYNYNADTDTLTVTAKADPSYGATKYKCAFDYLYVPKTVTLLDEAKSVTKDFVKTGDLTYTATFTDVPGGVDYNVYLNYKLGIDIGSDAQKAVDDAYAMVKALVNQVPGMILKADDMLNAVINTYLTGEQGYATLLWNLYNQQGALEALLSNLSADEQAKARADIKAILGPIFDVCGIELRAGNDTESTLYKAIAAVRKGTATDQQINQVKIMTANTNAAFGCSLNTTVGTGLGKGMLGSFLSYWNTARDLAVKNGAFNDLKGLGEYFGANYDSFYNSFLMGRVKPCLDKAVSLLGDDDNYVVDILADKGIDLNSFGDLAGMVDLAFSYAEKAYTHPSFTSIINKYGSLVPSLCGTYLEKAYTIASNPETYFVFETDGDLIEGFDFVQETNYTTEPDEDMVKVTVNVYGPGQYKVNNTAYATTQVFNVPMGGSFSVAPVELGSDALFSYFALSDANTKNPRLSPTGGDLTVYSDTIISLFFSTSEAQTFDVVFMTNYELSNTWLDTQVAGEIDEIPDVPEYAGATFLGWSTQNISGAAAAQAGVLTSAELLELVNDVERNMIYYAIYKVDNITVASSALNSTVSLNECFVQDHRAYFTALVSDRALANGDEIVEAGVLAAASAETIETATPNGGSGIIKGSLDLSKYGLPAFYTYAVHFNNHATDRTVFAKGFVTVRHADGTYNTIYTAVQSQVIEAY